MCRVLICAQGRTRPLNRQHEADRPLTADESAHVRNEIAKILPCMRHGPSGAPEGRFALRAPRRSHSRMFCCSFLRYASSAVSVDFSISHVSCNPAYLRATVCCVIIRATASGARSGAALCHSRTSADRLLLTQRPSTPDLPRHHSNSPPDDDRSVALTRKSFRSERSRPAAQVRVIRLQWHVMKG